MWKEVYLGNEYGCYLVYATESNVVRSTKQEAFDEQMFPKMGYTDPVRIDILWPRQGIEKLKQPIHLFEKHDQMILKGQEKPQFVYLNDDHTDNHDDKTA